MSCKPYVAHKYRGLKTAAACLGYELSFFFFCFFLSGHAQSGISCHRNGEHMVQVHSLFKLIPVMDKVENPTTSGDHLIQFLFRIPAKGTL